jgi:hypothetical protein
MTKVINFLKVWGVTIVITLMFIKTCSINNRIDKLYKDIDKQVISLDSTIKSETVSKNEIQKMLLIEGLKSEKRMIQSTDRKMLDVNRQTEIDKEIELLEKQ